MCWSLLMEVCYFQLSVLHWHLTPAHFISFHRGRLLSVNGKPLSEMTQQELVDIMHGPVDTFVHFSFASCASKRLKATSSPSGPGQDFQYEVSLRLRPIAHVLDR